MIFSGHSHHVQVRLAHRRSGQRQGRCLFDLAPVLVESPWLHRGRRMLQLVFAQRDRARMVLFVACAFVVVMFEACVAVPRHF
eukprot:4690774-Pyramimonas_sp.AAC.1